MKNPDSKGGLSRRKFLADCGKMSSIGAMSSMLNMTMMNKVLGASRPAGSITDYKAVVCLFMYGGNDSFNMIAPGGDAFSDYTAARGNLALEQSSMLKIIDNNTGSEYCLHGRLPEVKEMFGAGDLSFIANIGTLVEPLTLAEFDDGSKRKPYGISSHFDQTSQWQTSLPDVKGGSIGWMGRMSDIINDAANNNALVNMNMAPGGNNTLQQGRKSGPFSLRGGVNAFDLYDNDYYVRTAVKSQLDYNYQNLLKKHHEHVRKDAILQNSALQAIEANTVINTVFPNTSLGSQLLQVAKYIKSQGISGLNVNRHTFFVSEGGFDMHQNVIDRHAGKMAIISQALSAFNNAMKEIGYHDKVITYTASDFGRTLSSNNSGSDHGWGSNQIVMGGPVSGKKVFGTYPDLYTGSSTDTGRGRQLPTTSVDQLHASIAKWYGISNDSEMEEILPNIRNFYGAGDQGYAIDGIFA